MAQKHHNWQNKDISYSVPRTMLNSASTDVHARKLSMKTFRLFLPLLIATSGVTAHAQNLLRNSSFEDVPDASLGQGILPLDWYQASSIEPGADTFSDDGSYGLMPTDFGNFSASTAAASGVRFVAGWSLAEGESFGQVLSAPLQPRKKYQVSAWLHDSVRDLHSDDGGYDVYLANSSSALRVAKLYAAGGGTDAWQFRSFRFSTPSNVAQYTDIVFVPVSLGNATSYFGVDDVSLTEVRPFSIGP